MKRGVIYRSPRDKFLRDVERETERQSEHKVRVRYAGTYHAVCSCTWVGGWHNDREAAEKDAQAHGEAT